MSRCCVANLRRSVAVHISTEVWQKPRSVRVQFVWSLTGTEVASTNKNLLKGVFMDCWLTLLGVSKAQSRFWAIYSLSFVISFLRDKYLIWKKYFYKRKGARFVNSCAEHVECQDCALLCSTPHTAHLAVASVCKIKVIKDLMRNFKGRKGNTWRMRDKKFLHAEHGTLEKRSDEKLQSFPSLFPDPGEVWAHSNG